VHRESLERKRRGRNVEPGEDGRYSTQQILEILAGSIEAERLRKATAEAGLLELELAEKRKELLRTTDVILFCEGVFVTVRNHLWSSTMPEEERRHILEELVKTRHEDWIEAAQKQLGFTLNFTPIESAPEVS
jgi:hypothetical protein